MFCIAACNVIKPGTFIITLLLYDLTIIEEKKRKERKHSRIIPNILLPKLRLSDLLKYERLTLLEYMESV